MDICVRSSLRRFASGRIEDGELGDTYLPGWGEEEGTVSPVINPLIVFRSEAPL